MKSMKRWASSSLNLAAGAPPKPADHFRYEYDSSGQAFRSYRPDVDAQSWFSFDGGATASVMFNQANDGSDFGDWFSTSTLTGNQGGTMPPCRTPTQPKVTGRT